MDIIFSKKKNNRHVLTCKRNNGTTTWMNADEFFLRHDFLHYAVETALHFKSAFYGMIAGGIAITDFDLPQNKRSIELSEESLLAEHIVNLAMIEIAQGEFEDFNKALQNSLREAKQNLKDFFLTEAQLNSIHKTYSLILQQWINLDEGVALTLKFSE